MAAEVMKRGVNECPDLETIAAYLDRRLPARDREAMATHLAVCESCYFVFSEAAQVKKSVPAVAPRQSWWVARRVMWPAAALAAAATIILALNIAGVLPWLRSDAPELTELVAAVGTDRTIEARLSGGFAHGPLRGALRAGESTPPVSPDVRIAVARIEKEAIAQRTPQTLRSLGIAYLVIGDTRRAVPTLEEAADRPAPDAATLSDLAAAYLVRATRENAPGDLSKALATADRAMKVDPRLPEALFNRAYALQRLSLRDQAREAWEDYLKIDSTSGWATEARSHLSALNSPPQSELFQQELRQLEAATKDLKPQAIVDAIRRWPDTAREWAEDQLLHQWPQLVTDGHLDDANVLATRVAPVADGLARERGDEFTKGVVTAVLAASDDQERTRLLAGAHMRYSSALKDYQEDRILQSAPQFESAFERLDGAGSPLAASSRLYAAIATYYAPDLTGALTQLQTLKDVAAARRYTRILGLTHRMIGLVHVVQGRLGAGLDEYRAALRCFQQVGDIDNEAGIRASIAETLDYIGERDTAWVERYAALSRLSAVEDPRRRHTILQGAAVAAVRQQMPEAALYFQHAALHNAIGWGRPPAIVNVRLNRAEVYTQLGSAHLAEQDLADAERLLATIEDPSLVARSEARILLARGQTMTEQAPGHAVDALDKALVYFKQGGGASWPLARAHLARGRAHVASAKDDIAEEDFQAGITVFERMRAALTSETLRSSYFEQPWDLFAEMVRLQAIRRQRPDRAIRFAEQARARTLLETAAPMSVPVDPGAVRNALPFGVTVIYYASLDDRLLTWVLTRSSLDFVDVPVRRADLSRLVDQYRDESALMRRGRNVPPLMALYDALVRPIRDKLAPGTRISVVPDGPLHAVPFAALLRREDTRYLIQDYAVSVTPSMTIFQLRDGRSPGDSRPMPEGALIVGNPNARDGSNVVVNLPGAQAEAAEIATLYRDSEVLVGPAATKARFLSALGKHAVVHFAGHAIPNEEFPGLSRLLLSADAAGDDTLFAHEIAAQRLDRTRLVVLAACRTNTGRIRRGEGVFSLARPFLAAGVQTVVASLSDVDDRASHRLFVAFHRALRQGQTPADALRSAQLAALAETDPNLQHSANWATFTIIGGLSAIANPGE